MTLCSYLLWQERLLKARSLCSAAKSKPIIAEPEIHGGHSLDGVTGFLVLMSEGLYKALEAAHGPGQANQVSVPSQETFPQLLIYCRGVSCSRTGRPPHLCCECCPGWVPVPCASPFQPIMMGELLCQASFSRQLPAPLGGAL